MVAIGFSMSASLEKVAREFPQRRFVLIDAVLALPNVRSISFKEHEGSFLAGLLAGMASKSGRVGFVGGMDIPLIRRFQCGYEQGARHANPQVQVRANMTGATPAGWADPARGAAFFFPNTRTVLERLAALKPRLLACMHGSAYQGDGGALLRELANKLGA